MRDPDHGRNRDWQRTLRPRYPSRVLSPREPFRPLEHGGDPARTPGEEIFGTFADTKLAQFSGKLKFAHEATLFLDEVGALPVPAQYLLLRMLEEKSVAKIGGNLRATVDVRIIASTNRELEPMVKDGSFLKELYYRLKGVTINLPPLRERLEDLPPLCVHLLNSIAPRRSVDGDALRVLRAYPWPGNVRELRNVLEQVCVHHDKPKLTATEFESVLPSG